jgi:pyruvate/2-oxoglutarate dehydrogenase complex dihydrolipoamide dehydrogenase (E3) component
VPYDFLVIATGSSYPSCAAIKCTDDFSMVATAYHTLSKQETARMSLASRVLVIGGGIVGMELVAEVAMAFPDVHVTLVAGRSGLLPECPSWGVARARRWIARQSNVLLIEGLRCSADKGVAQSVSHAPPHCYFCALF